VPQESAPLRVGQIDFLNCLPLAWGMQRIADAPTVTLVPDSPERLSDALIRGDLDISPISAIEALRHPDDLLMLPEVAVCADGPVQSVVLVSRRPLAELEGAEVALGSTSRTSVELARLLLEVRDGVHPTYTVMAPELDAMLERADAAVLIGDPALRAYLTGAEAQGCSVHDLAQEWVAWQGVPMTFAVWAVRAEVLRERPDEVARVREWFAQALKRAAADPAGVAREAATRSGLSAEVLATYFEGLTLRPTVRTWAGLERFAVELMAAGRDAELRTPPLLTD
jgi:chorismate dehydratase